MAVIENEQKLHIAPVQGTLLIRTMGQDEIAYYINSTHKSAESIGKLREISYRTSRTGRFYSIKLITQAM